MKESNNKHKRTNKHEEENKVTKTKIENTLSSITKINLGLEKTYSYRIKLKF
jgi:hypothetical protein